MKRVVRWAIENSPAMNMFMVTILFVGMLSVLGMRREVMPEFELEIILVQVPYPCLLYTSPSPRDKRQSRMPSSA